MRDEKEAGSMQLQLNIPKTEKRALRTTKSITFSHSLFLSKFL
jgi:hypothetical protein